jgi:hypothetical protein
MLCVRATTRVHLKELGRQRGIKGITFASAEEMLSFLGVTPGSVCLFALMNDQLGRVCGLLDDSLSPEEEIQNHPLENTATVVAQTADIERFCQEETSGKPLCEEVDSEGSRSPGRRPQARRCLERRVIARPFARDEAWSKQGNPHGRGFPCGISM